MTTSPTRTAPEPTRDSTLGALSTRVEMVSEVVDTVVGVDRMLQRLTALKTSYLAMAHQLAEEDPAVEDARSRQMAL